MSWPDPEQASHSYPEGWSAIAAEVQERAGGRCECLGECRNPFCPSGQDPAGRCIMQEQRHYPRLWVVALDRNPCNSGTLADRPNLRAFCASCADAFLWELKQKPAQDPGDLTPRRAAAVQGTLDL